MNVNFSIISAFIILIKLKVQVDPIIWPDNATPLLRFHYRTIIAHAGCSVPLPRIGAQTLAGSPLESLSSHRGDRFPCSTSEPESKSHHLRTRRQVGSRQFPSHSRSFSRDVRQHPGFDVIHYFRHFNSGSLAFVFLIHTWQGGALPFPLTFTTRALYHAA